ncbi:MAG: tRNA (adenosine(37)-N6)-dimethylallyltransferase MiaA [Lentimicrobiaceae bacterium]|jgi:tRNA dimethylallyltransferase|nr:tRNA (adenosine(37)-N6)-dimethylallyltransferase MiaA [Lentimicrobiaceae bacterium]MDD4598871.1 tRNA (adenosine(37)-N6)-dimethylallyltransferase MiaA [Lentimicrobiaceae bacterium]
MKMERSGSPVLIIITGPTAVGKTSIALIVARHFNCEIISADSRQFYREIPIGTAMPLPAQLEAVRHHFVAFLDLHEKYDVSIFEQQALTVLDKIFQENHLAILTGGSGLYIQAVEKGLDQLPGSNDEIHDQLVNTFTEQGIGPLRDLLKLLDPEYYHIVDLNNPKRIIRALDVCLSTGKTFSSFRKNQPFPRTFRSIKIGLNLPRAELHHRINNRVDQMIRDGLIEEARSVYPFRHLNALNTVGFKEIFEYFDGKMSLDNAIEKIKTNTRRYARRQITWLRKDPDVIWCEPRLKEVIDVIENALTKIDTSNF